MCREHEGKGGDFPRIKPSIRKTVRRVRKLYLPPEPRNIDELNVIADRYTKTVQEVEQPPYVKKANVFGWDVIFYYGPRQEGNLLDLDVTKIKTECIEHRYDIKSEIVFEESAVPIDFPMLKSEAEEEFCELDQVKEVKLEVTAEENEVLTESRLFVLQEQNFTDQHVTGMKEEYKDKSQDLTTEIKFEEDPVPISFPVVKREPELQGEQFGFGEGKGTREAIALLRRIGQGYLDKNKEVYIVFVDLEKAF
ncbi:hypothetical protein ANN_27509 [Periplaneta americana]|uniref:Uncharacterized protein n=1 Tax=Periplaneta americana TaxID=6978 RepID=A0ABQ8RW48_PERAM|nr:hypothetical protein ANN_27509 [Periplaneta americana]